MPRGEGELERVAGNPLVGHVRAPVLRHGRGEVAEAGDGFGMYRIEGSPGRAVFAKSVHSPKPSSASRYGGTGRST